MPTAIEAFELTKRYGAALALHGVSAVVPQGRVVGLLGHNGAGKSTLIKLALGLIAPSSGAISVLGRSSVADARELHAHVGYLPENVAFYGNLTGREVIRYFEALKKAPRGQGAKLLERVGLGHALEQRVRTYSKGMRQRLGLAQALLGAPELVLFDEPTTGLDPMATRDFYSLVDELRAAGTTVVISSHLLSEIEPHLDRAVILGAGQVLAQGSVRELRESAGLPVTVLVRFTDGINGFLHQRWLEGLPVRPRPGASDVIEVDVAARDKMDLVRHLMAMHEVADIELKQPTLARLYQVVGAGNGPATEDAS